MDKFKQRSWPTKFRDAGRGIGRAVIGETSFWIQLPVAAAVVALSAWLQIGPVQWCLIVFSIGLVLVVELLNSAVERLSRAVTDQPDADVGLALDISSGAVLTAALCAVVIGGIVLGPPLWQQLWGS